MSSTAESELDRKIGKFSLIRRLGAGGMGQVFLARQETLDRLVALKVLHKELAEDEVFLERFRREAKAAAVFQHPNVVAVIDADTDPETGEEYIAFEFVEGASLEEVARREGRLAERQALEVVAAVARGLAYAESKGIVHRDVKPENILISTDGTIKLADLGLAKSFDRGQDRAVTQTGVIVGTPLYMAPEQALGYEVVDVRADLYALGLVLWRVLTGLVPFDEDGTTSSLQILSRHINEDLPDVRTRNPEVSEEVSDLLRGMCARERGERYASAADLLEDVERLLAGEGPLGPSKDGDPQRTATLSSADVQVGAGAATVIEPSVVPDTARKRRRRSSGGWTATRPANWTPNPPAQRSPRRGGKGVVVVLGLTVLGVGGFLGQGALRGDDGPEGRADPQPPALDPGGGSPLAASGEGVEAREAKPPPAPAVPAPDLADELGLVEHLETTSRLLFTDVREGKAHLEALKLAAGWDQRPELQTFARGLDGVLAALDPEASEEAREAGRAEVRAVMAEQRRNIIPGKVAAAVDRELALWESFAAGLERLELALSDPRGLQPALKALKQFPSTSKVEAQAEALVELADTVDFHAQWSSSANRRVEVAKRRKLLLERLAGTAVGTALRDEVLALGSLIHQITHDEERSLLLAVHVVSSLPAGSRSRFLRARQREIPQNAALRNIPARGLVIELARSFDPGQRLTVEAGKIRLVFDAEGVGETAVRWGPAPVLLLEPREEDLLIRLPDASPGEMRVPIAKGGVVRFSIRGEGVSPSRVTLLKLPPRG
jgi:serine/threonine protein kinase